MVLVPVGIFSNMYPDAFPFFSPSTWGMLGVYAVLIAYGIQVYWAGELFEHLDGAPWDSTREYTPWEFRPLRSRDTIKYGDAPRNFREH